MRLRHRGLGQRAGAVAAALLIAAVGFGSIGDSRAQNQPQDQRAQKKAPIKGAAQPLRKGPIGTVGPGRAADSACTARAERTAAECARRAAGHASEFPGCARRSGANAAPERVRQGSEHRSGQCRAELPLRHQPAGCARLRRQPAGQSRIRQPARQSHARQPAGRAKLPVRQPQPATRLHASRPAHARRQRRDAAAAAGAALHPSRRDAFDPRPDAALSAARRAQLHRHSAGQRNALRAGRNGLPLAGHLAAADRGGRAPAQSDHSGDAALGPDRRDAGSFPHRRQPGRARRRARHGSRADRLAAELRLRSRAGDGGRAIAARAPRTSNTSRTSCSSPKCTRSRPARA